jgi:HEAT repeat protein
MKKLLPWFAVLIALAAGPGAPLAADDDDIATLDSEEQLVEAAGLSSEGPGLLEFFRARARTEAEPGRVDELVRRFAGPSLEDRLQAGADLVAVGPLAIAGLRRVANDMEAPDVRESARRCLAWVEGPERANLAVAAARLVARRRPAGAAEVLLAYLPFADNEEVVREVSTALRAVAVTGGRPEPALVRALSDPLPLRRAIASAALSQTAPKETPAVEKLLQDANPEVRMTAALSLAKANNAAAIPVLIDLVAVLPANKRSQVEDYLQELAGEWAPGGGPGGEDEIARRIRRDAWAGWWANTEGSALIALFAKHTLTPAEQTKIKDAIRRLGHKTYVMREKAVIELVAAGRRILPMLRDALKDNELEIVRRAQRCIQRIEQEPANRLPAAALRLLALRKPAGAAETLLAYLPFAEEDYVDDLKSALAALAVRDGKPEPALVQALTATHAGVRGAAAEALAAAPEVRPALRKLLADADLTVRLRTAIGLAPRDAQAVPVLIDLIAKLPDDQAGQVHDFLVPLAGDQAPKAPQDNAEARKESSAAWAAWWKDNSAKVDLAKLSRPSYQQLLGYTVISEHNTGRIVELGRDRKPRWSITGTQNPVDAWVLPNNRVVVSEYSGNKVTCRDMKGNILWLKQMNCNPHNIQVLPNGNIFIAGNIQLAEVDRNGKDVALQINNVQQLVNSLGQITGAYKARNGQIIVMGQNGRCVRIDAHGKELKSFTTGRGNAWLDVTANGRIIMATNGGNKIAEYNTDGKLLVELDVQQVSMVTGLPNGSFLVASHNTGRVFELDRKGKTIWEYHTQGPFRARAR